MKPTKNKVFCHDCGRHKMVFESEKKANTFIKFNSDDIEFENGYAPKRSYYCIACNSWHVTSKEEVVERKSRTEQVLEKYEQEKEEKKIRQEQLKSKKKKEKNINLEKNTNLDKQKSLAEKRIKMAETKKKESLFKETKAKRRKISELLKNIELNIKIIETIKSSRADQCLEVINDSFSKLEVFNNIIIELETILKEAFLESEIQKLFEVRLKRKIAIERKLNNLSMAININS